MKRLLLIAVFAIGCSPEMIGDDDASSGSGSSSSGSCVSCPVVVLTFGEEKFCELCTCAGMPCKTHLPDNVVIEGTCGDDLQCSVPCVDLSAPTQVSDQKDGG